ncbi:MAG: AAA family ATPase [Chitinophagales bacterium]|jgi:GTPase SAR1 family protein|nr:AAA family ATPase [Chitinophagales bacterium]
MDIIKLTLNFISTTDKSLFLTGKAGTGKTTFLNALRQNIYKKCIVVAPTGIAAINANGVTIHSFFNLPLGPFLPGKSQLGTSIDSNKKKLIKELELLIIDEVSMLRADTLDAIDYILRTTRKKEDVPFGDVQVLFVGDLCQLSPIIADEEWRQIKQYYRGINFLNALSIKIAPPVYLELTQVYRQTDDNFIQLLNQVRTGNCSQREVDLINTCYKPDVVNEKSPVILTTHNAKVDSINENGLRILATQEEFLWAEVDGDFDEVSFPTENCLKLKIGARIMLLRNDKGKDKKYYNGKTGLVKAIVPEELSILLDDGATIQIQKEVWSKIKYVFNESTNSVNPEVVGTFRQFPVRLAWAITIHKSQGLTFENAVLDLEDVFVPGQAYVALSRLKSLQGLSLSSKVNLQIMNNSAFAAGALPDSLSEDKLIEILSNEQALFAERKLCDYFSWVELSAFFSQNGSLLNNYAEIADTLGRISHCTTTSLKFTEEISSICKLNQEGKYQLLEARISAASSYYLEEIDNRIMPVVRAEYSKTKGSINFKLLFRFNAELKKLLEQKLSDFLAAEKFARDFLSNIIGNHEA